MTGTHVPVADTTLHPQRSYVHTLTSQRRLGSKSRTHSTWGAGGVRLVADWCMNDTFITNINADTIFLYS